MSQSYSLGAVGALAPFSISEQPSRLGNVGRHNAKPTTAPNQSAHITKPAYLLPHLKSAQSAHSANTHEKEVVVFGYRGAATRYADQTNTRLHRDLPRCGEIPRSDAATYIACQYRTREGVDAVRDRLVASGRLRVRRTRNRMGGRVELWRWVP